jgi:hypothetical protein
MVAHPVCRGLVVHAEHGSVAPEHPTVYDVLLHGYHLHEKVVDRLEVMVVEPDVLPPGLYAGMVNDREVTIVSSLPTSLSRMLNVTVAAPEAHTAGYA